MKELKERGVPVKFGPASQPEKYEIDLLEVAKLKLSLDTIDDFDEAELEIGDRLPQRPYADTGRATMPPTYLCEGSVWLNFHSSEGLSANIGLVPHIDTTRHLPDLHPHHNFRIYWTDFNGSIGSTDRIPGHLVPKDEPVAISIICGKEIRKGTIDVRT